jgi:hypothetical protein
MPETARDDVTVAGPGGPTRGRSGRDLLPPPTMADNARTGAKARPLDLRT